MIVYIYQTKNILGVDYAYAKDDRGYYGWYKMEPAELSIPCERCGSYDGLRKLESGKLLCQRCAETAEATGQALTGSESTTYTGA